MWSIYSQQETSIIKHTIKLKSHAVRGLTLWKWNAAGEESSLYTAVITAPTSQWPMPDLLISTGAWQTQRHGSGRCFTPRCWLTLKAATRKVPFKTGQTPRLCPCLFEVDHQFSPQSAALIVVRTDGLECAAHCGSRAGSLWNARHCIEQLQHWLQRWNFFFLFVCFAWSCT